MKHLCFLIILMFNPVLKAQDLTIEETLAYLGSKVTASIPASANALKKYEYALLFCTLSQKKIFEDDRTEERQLEIRYMDTTITYVPLSGSYGGFYKIYPDRYKKAPSYWIEIRDDQDARRVLNALKFLRDNCKKDPFD